MSDIVERAREMPSSLNDACRKLELCVDEIERLRIAAPNVLFYKEQAEYWREIGRKDRAERANIRAATIEECARALANHMPDRRCLITLQNAIAIIRALKEQK